MHGSCEENSPTCCLSVYGQADVLIQLGESMSTGDYVAEEIVIALVGDCALDTNSLIFLHCHLWNRNSSICQQPQGMLDDYLVQFWHLSPQEQHGCRASSLVQYDLQGMYRNPP